VKKVEITRDPGTGEPVMPEFRVRGVDGITALSFEPERWPCRTTDDHTATVMRVIHLTSGQARHVAVDDLSGLATWFERGPRQYEVNDVHSTGVLYYTGMGCADVHLWRHNYEPAAHGHRFHRTWRMTLDPEAMIEVSKFLARLRLTGWKDWNREGDSDA
jgi:hypothetical protein